MHTKKVGCEMTNDEGYWYTMSSEYSYEKEEGLYQAERLIKELQRVRADWKKGLGDPQSFNEWNNHFTAAITKAMKEEEV
jgi:hypothetical protein